MLSCKMASTSGFPTPGKKLAATRQLGMVLATLVRILRSSTFLSREARLARGMVRRHWSSLKYAILSPPLQARNEGVARLRLTLVLRMRTLLEIETEIAGVSPFSCDCVHLQILDHGSRVGAAGVAFGHLARSAEPGEHRGTDKVPRKTGRLRGSILRPRRSPLTTYCIGT